MIEWGKRECICSDGSCALTTKHRRAVHERDSCCELATQFRTQRVSLQKNATEIFICENSQF